MNPIPPSDEHSREDLVALCLRQCALLVDPRYGSLQALADELEIHISTLQLWIKQGRVPPKACKRLVKRFTRRYVNFDLMVGA